ncbi:MAG: 30S ribosomal protein S7 [Candidatus Bathyarchaeia archaeon]
MTQDEARVSAPETVMLWHKWSFKDIEVKDVSLKRYISLRPILIPHSGGRHEHQRFAKSQVNIVERFTNNLMRPGSAGGKKAKAANIVRVAFEIIHLKTGKNPIEVLVSAVENSAPAEDTTRIMYGGIVYHRAVDVSPQRRVDLALRFLADGARNASLSSSKPIEECVADELIAASEGDSRSYAVSKKDEMERVALSSR